MPGHIGMTCAFCGKVVGEGSADSLTLGMAIQEHVETCEAHPLFIANKRIAALEEKMDRVRILTERIG